MTIAIIVLLSLMLIAYGTFAYRYVRFSPWRATWQGVTLLSQKVTLALLVAFFLVDTLIVGDWPARDIILIAIVTLLMLEAFATLFGLVHVQRQHRPVSKRQGTGYVPPEHLERTDPRRRKP